MHNRLWTPIIFCDKINKISLGGRFMALHYCKKCGRVVEVAPDKTGYMDMTCDHCNSTVYPVPEKYWLDGLDFLMTNEQKELLREELVKTAPEFDRNLYAQRADFVEKQSAEFNSQVDRIKSFEEERNRGPKCPSCGSTNISKIGFLNRAVSTGFLGLASSKIGKTHKCNNCGSMW